MGDNGAHTVFRARYLPLILACLVLISFILFTEYSGWMGKEEASSSAPFMDQEQLHGHLEGKGRQLLFFSQPCRLNQNAPFSPGLAEKFNVLKPGDSSWLRVTGQVWFSGPADSLKCSIVATCNHRGTNYKYFSLPLTSLKLRQNDFNLVTLDYLIPRCVDAEDLIQVYFWNWGRREVVIKNIGVTIF
jgi:hypothetical protein